MIQKFYQSLKFPENGFVLGLCHIHIAMGEQRLSEEQIAELKQVTFNNLCL